MTKPCDLSPILQPQFLRAISSKSDLFFTEPLPKSVRVVFLWVYFVLWWVALFPLQTEGYRWRWKQSELAFTVFFHPRWLNSLVHMSSLFATLVAQPLSSYFPVFGQPFNDFLLPSSPVNRTFSALFLDNLLSCLSCRLLNIFFPVSQDSKQSRGSIGGV